MLLDPSYCGDGDVAGECLRRTNANGASHCGGGVIGHEFTEGSFNFFGNVEDLATIGG